MKTEKSMIETAYEIMEASNTPIAFTAFYDKIGEALAMSPEEKNERIGDFYTDLTLDGRFVSLTDNTWDLRSRHTYDKVHIDVNDVYSQVEESDADEEDKKEEKEYNAEIEGKTLEEEEPLEQEDGEEKSPEETLSSLGVK